MLTPVANEELFKTISKYTNQKKLLVKRLKEFILHKMKYPANGSIPGQYPGFGSSDKKFKSGGNFGKETKGIAHAHLTDNISITYLVDGDKLNLYGVYTHDSIGTGQPPNMNRQQQMAAQWSNMTFDQPVDLGQLDDPEEPNKPEVKKTAAKVDYTAKPKQPPAPPAAKPAVNPTVELTKKVDAYWPQRGLLNKLSRAQSKEEALNIISQEAQYIAAIRQRGQKIYPNVMDYFKGLEALVARYTK